jgi:hypothetical protein
MQSCWLMAHSTSLRATCQACFNFRLALPGLAALSAGSLPLAVRRA